MKFLKQDLKNGLSKLESFEKAEERGDNLKKVTRYLSSIPDPEESKKFCKFNYVLISVYVILFLFGLFGALPILTGLPVKGIIIVMSVALIIPVALIWLLIAKRAIGYLLLCFFMFKGVLDIGKDLGDQQTLMLIGIVINLLMLGFSAFLKLKLFPFQNFFNNRKDSNGLFVYTKI